MIKNKILVIDDELSIREMLSEVLLLENYEVKVAENGLHALQLLDYFIPDIILCDIMMPIMDGNLFYATVNSNKSLCAIPFVFLSAKNDSVTKQKSVIDGVDAFLSKPFKIEELTAILKNKIERFLKIKQANTNLYMGEQRYFSHEVNTPLNGILGVINLLIKNHNSLSKNDILMFCNYVKISAERLNRTMQNLFLYQKIIENHFNLEEPTACDIINILANMQEKFSQITDFDIDRIIYDVKPINFTISETYLSYILFELVDNALKFSGKNKIYISGKKINSECYELIIQDTGIGFKDDNLNKIDAGLQFEREKREKQGLGLGLFLSKYLITKINGVINIVSEENVGTKVTLLLPI